MTTDELIKYLDEWAPPGAAWKRDNVGLQVGSRENQITNILLCLELTQEVLNEALAKNCNFIFTHHPMIFNPIKRLDIQKDSKAKLIEQLIKKDISVFSAHTNLDFTKGGVSFELAKTLGLKNLSFLEFEYNNRYKLVVFVPPDNLEKLSERVFSAGAGVIGEYKNCSYRLSGTGTFLGSDISNPSIGKKQNFETVDEVRLEVVVDEWNINKVVTALIETHPYEEPAYDIYPLKNKNVNFGEGVIGELNNVKSENEFLEHVCNALKITALRFNIGKIKKIKKVAVCGGAGSSLLNKAIASGAHAFITADIKYHTFQEALGNILLIDAGHYETEILSLNSVKRNIEKKLTSKHGIKVFKYSKSTNPVKFYKHQGVKQIG